VLELSVYLNVFPSRIYIAYFGIALGIVWAIMYALTARIRKSVR
jgi:hypothetical protein